MSWAGGSPGSGFQFSEGEIMQSVCLCPRASRLYIHLLQRLRNNLFMQEVKEGVGHTYVGRYCDLCAFPGIQIKPELSVSLCKGHLCIAPACSGGYPVEIFPAQYRS